MRRRLLIVTGARFGANVLLLLAPSVQIRAPFVLLGANDDESEMLSGT